MFFPPYVPHEFLDVAVTLYHVCTPDVPEDLTVHINGVEKWRFRARTDWANCDGWITGGLPWTDYSCFHDPRQGSRACHKSILIRESHTGVGQGNAMTVKFGCNLNEALWNEGSPSYLFF